MATPANVARPFSALNGSEVKEIILNEIRRHLEADYRFKQHLTYPVVTWEWALAMQLYPSDEGQGKVTIHLEKTNKAPQKEGFAPAPPIEELPPAEVVEMRSRRVVAAPMSGETADSARRDAGLEVPSQRIVRGPSGTRITVDAPEVPIPAPQPARAAEVEQGATARVINRARETKSTAAAPARSVSIRTRANPTGVEVAPPAGSPMDAERIAEAEAQEAARAAKEAGGEEP